jgi:hypothetical protein
VGLNLSRLKPGIKRIALNLPRAGKILGIDVRVTSGFRSRSLQTKLYNDYLAGINPYPAAPPGTSKHETGEAIDVLSTNTETLVTLLTSVGLSWAGPDDPIHFEIPSGQAAISPRTNELPPARAIPWESLSRKDQMALLLAGVNRKVMKPW